MPIVWLGLIGALFSMANWGCVFLLILRKKAPSSLPLVGGLSLLVAIAATPLSPIRRWAAFGLLVDPWFVGTFVGAVGLVIKAYRQKLERAAIETSKRS